MPEISLAAVHKIVKKIEPNIRIGLLTKEELRKCVEEYATSIAEIAISTAKTANRNTVLQQDIIAAREQLMVGISFHKSSITP